MKVTALFAQVRGAVVVLGALGVMGVVGQTVDVSWYNDNVMADTFYIASESQLAGLAQIVNGDYGISHNFAGKTVVLTRNLHLSVYSGRNFNDGKGWKPIGRDGGDRSFVGVFDGGGHVVSGLFINDNSLPYAGLFGKLGNGETYRDFAAIRNLAVVGVNINASYYVGGLVGAAEGIIENCYTSGTVRGQAQNVGGIVGNMEGVIANSYSVSSVVGGVCAGGVVGAAGTLTGATEVRGCVGLNDSVGTTGSYSPTSPQIAGHVVGCAYGDAVLIDNAAYRNIDGNATLRGNASGVVINVLDIMDIHRDSTIGGRFTEAGGWSVEAGRLPGLSGGPVELPAHLRLRLNSVGSGTYDDPYMIYAAEQLAELATRINAGDSAYISLSNAPRYYKLGSDIDLGVAPYNTGAGWTPIGTETFPFNAIFDGGGHKIAGLYVNRPDLDNAGLFGYIGTRSVSAQGWSGTVAVTVENLELSGVNVTGGNNVGALAGTTRGSVLNCRVSGTVGAVGSSAGGLIGHYDRTALVASSDTLGYLSFEGDVSGVNRVGGIAGRITVGRVNGILVNSYSAGTVTGTGNNVGGIVGQFNASEASGTASRPVFGVLLGCYSSSRVSGNSAVGGLVGLFSGAADNVSNVVKNSYSIADTVSGSSNTGGVVGVAACGIANCYAANAVIGQAVGGGDNIGGIAGDLTLGGHISNSAALNSRVMASSSLSGRVVGHHLSDSVLTRNSAFSGMAVSPPISSGNRKDGLGISAQDICADSTIGGLFVNTDTSGVWTLALGKLPGLFGRAVDMPEHLVYTPPPDDTIPPDTTAVRERGRDIPEITVAGDAAAVVPIVLRASAFTAGPNPVDRSAGSVNLYVTGSSVNPAGSFTIFNAAGNVIRRIDIVNNVTAWDLKDAAGRTIPVGTYLARGSINIDSGKRERVSFIIGVR